MQEPVHVDRRLDLTKSLDQIVAFPAWRKRFDIRSHPASEIDQAFFKWRVVIGLVTPHGLAPGLFAVKASSSLYCPAGPIQYRIARDGGRD